MKAKKCFSHIKHSFGKSEEFEQRLDEVTGNFTQFNEKTAEGNYLDAREIVLSIRGSLEKIKKRIWI